MSGPRQGSRSRRVYVCLSEEPHECGIDGKAIFGRAEESTCDGVRSSIGTVVS